MPNYCYNSLQITGSKELLQDFRNKYIIKDEHGEHLEFEKVIPMPKELDVGKNSAAEHVWDLLYGIEQYKISPEGLESLGINSFPIYQLMKELESSGETQETAIEQILEHHPTAKEEAEQYQKNLVKHGHKTWYDWRIENWGTKWNSIEGSVSEDETSLFIDFDTAWSPCTPIVKKLIEEHPELVFSFSYDEPGCGFRGEIEGSNGQVTKNHYEEYEWEDEEEAEDE